MRTAADLWTTNFEKFAANLLNVNSIPCVMRDWIIMQTKLTLFCHEPHFESYFDTQPPFQLDEAILTGSFSEGLFLYSTEPPDMDFMCVLKNVLFSQEDQDDGSLLLREDTPFVYAFVTKKETQNLWREFFDDRDKQAEKHRLSSRKLKQKLHDNHQKRDNKMSTMFGVEQCEEVTEGAAITISKSEPTISYCDCLVDFIKTFLRQPINEPFDAEKEYGQSMANMPDLLYNRIVLSSDVVLAISCEGWPSCAKEWITRERVWPDKHSVERIAQKGFHIVPKSSSDGDFRLSFSCAETMLIQTLSSMQHKVIRAFKAVIKFHQNSWSPNPNKILSSYHLKTIAFWHFEKTCQESWTEESIVHHLVTLLEELANALRVQYLPMYFMPKVNLLREVNDPEVTLELVEKILELTHNFFAMSEAVSKITSLDVFFRTDYHELIHILEIKLEKVEGGRESSFTWYDLFNLIVRPENI